MLGRQMLPRATPILRISFIIPRSTFTTTFIQQKTATETAKDVLKKADRVMSDELVEGIEKGQALKNAASEMAGIKTEKAAAKVDANMAEVKGKATEMKGEVKGKLSEMEGKAKGTYEEVKGKM